MEDKFIQQHCILSKAKSRQKQQQSISVKESPQEHLPSEKRRHFQNQKYLLFTFMFTLVVCLGLIITLLLFLICSVMFIEVVCLDSELALPVCIILSIMLMPVLCLDPVAVPVFMSCDMMSMGTGNTMVLLFSAEMLFSVCRYLSCR